MAINFELVTPAKLLRSEEVHMVVVPGSEGDFGVLERHAPVMSTVRDGEIKIFKSANSKAEIIRVEGGFAKVDDKGLTILAEKVIGDD